MPTIAQTSRTDHRRLDHSPVGIGPAPTDPAPALGPLLADLAERPLPRDPHVVEALREVACTSLTRLPAGHALAGADVSDAGAALLVRLLVRLARELEPVGRS